MKPLFGLLAALAVSSAVAELPTSYPSWWAQQGIVDEALYAEHGGGNQGVLLQGQLLHFADGAIRELDLQLALVGGAGFSLESLRDSQLTPAYHSPANIGQLKYVCSFFYDRFAEIGFGFDTSGWPADLVLNSGPEDSQPLYPWQVASSPTNYEVAVIGQLKFMFSWDLAAYVAQDSDGDGLPDYWEHAHGSLEMQPYEDLDGDGFSNRLEFLWETSPTEANGLPAGIAASGDSDNDGLSDAYELAYGLNPNDGSDGKLDSDGDRIPNHYEYKWWKDPLSASDYPKEPGISPVSSARLFIIDPTLTQESDFEKWTLSAANTNAQSGDMLLAYDGVYPESLTISGKSYLLAAAPEQLVILDGKHSLSFGITTNGGAHPLINGLIVQRYTIKAIVVNNTNPRYYRCIFQDSARGVHISQGSPLFESCIIRRNSGSNPGIYTNAGYPIFRNCSIIDNKASGGASGVHNEGIRGSGYKRVANSRFYNCLFWNSTNVPQATISSPGNYSYMEFRSCLIRDGDSDGDPDFSATSSSDIISLDPNLMAGGWIAEESACIDLGVTNKAAERDFRGVSFSEVAIPDIGAYEFFLPGENWMNDADGDRLIVAGEYAFGSYDWRVDSDLDGVPDAFEFEVGTNPTLYDDKTDSDGDGFPNDYERRWATDPGDSLDYPAIPGPNIASNGNLYIVDHTLQIETAFEKSQINDAINLVSAGDIIVVKSGVYTEALNISSTDGNFLLHCAEEVIISGDGSGNGLYVRFADSFRMYRGEIRGFDRGIYVDSVNALFHGVKITNNKRALSTNKFNGGSPRFENCLISGNNGSYPTVSVTGGYPRFVHCSIINNHTSSALGAVFVDMYDEVNSRSVHAYITNSIIWNPEAKTQLSMGIDRQGKTVRVNLDSVIVLDADGDGLGDYEERANAVNTSTYDPLVNFDGDLAISSAAGDFPNAQAGLVVYDLKRQLRADGRSDLGCVESFDQIEGAKPGFFIQGTGLGGDDKILINLSDTPEQWVQIQWDIVQVGVFEPITSPFIASLNEVRGKAINVRVFDVYGNHESSTYTIQDIDDDHLPDVWEMSVYGHLRYSGGDDPDLNGYSNEVDFDMNTPLGPNGIELIIFNL